MPSGVPLPCGVPGSGQTNSTEILWTHPAALLIQRGSLAPHPRAPTLPLPVGSGGLAAAEGIAHLAGVKLKHVHKSLQDQGQKMQFIDPERAGK